MCTELHKQGFQTKDVQSVRDNQHRQRNHRRQRRRTSPKSERGGPHRAHEQAKIDELDFDFSLLDANEPEDIFKNKSMFMNCIMGTINIGLDIVQKK